MQRSLASWWWVLVPLAAACPSDNDDGDTSDTGAVGTGLDLNVPPVVGGEWAQPGLLTSWHWQRQGPIATNVDADIVVVDLDADSTSVAVLQTNDRTVFCSFSVGATESRRTDLSELPQSVQGNAKADDSTTFWLDIRAQAVLDLMEARFEQARLARCDGLDLLDVELHEADTGFGITRDEQLAYARYLYNEAHRRGFAVALHNAGTLVPDLVDYADVAIVERCHETATCAAFEAFPQQGKPILNAEFSPSLQADPKSLCVQALADNTRTAILSENLDNTFRVSCDTDYPSQGPLADALTFGFYAGRRSPLLFGLSGVDVAVVRADLPLDSVAAVRSESQTAARIRVGSLIPSERYWLDGEPVLGQAVVDAHPEWFVSTGPVVADLAATGWQDFVLDQAAEAAAYEHDALFLEDIDAVAGRTELLAGLATLLERLDTETSAAFLIQAGGVGILGTTAPYVDAVVVDGFSLSWDPSTGNYGDAGPGDRGAIEALLEYRLDGGVVIARDFATPATNDVLVCEARTRALLHRFVPAASDGPEAEGRFTYPLDCPWPLTPRIGLDFDPPILHLWEGAEVASTVSHAGEGGFDVAISASVGSAPLGVLASLGQSRLDAGASTPLTVRRTGNAPVGANRLPIVARTAGDEREYLLKLRIHSRSLWVANPALAVVDVFDEPSRVAEPRPVRRTEEPLAAPSAVLLDFRGRQWVVERVLDADATQPAGRILVYDPFEFDAPFRVIDVGLNYPFGIAQSPDGTIYVANSSLDETGTSRGLPSIGIVPVDATEAQIGLRYDFATYGEPLHVAVPSTDTLVVGTSTGMVLGFSLPADPEPTPDFVLSGAGESFDRVGGLAFDADGDLWISATLGQESRVIEVPSGFWDSASVVDNGDLTAIITDGVASPGHLAFDDRGHLWVVNATNASGGTSTVARYDAPADGAMPVQQIVLGAPGATGLAVGAPGPR